MILEGTIQNQGANDLVTWWIGSPVNEDAYHVVVVRYTSRNGGPVADTSPAERISYFLTEDGGWQEFPAGDQIQPALKFNGLLLHALQGGELIDRRQVADSLQSLADRILKAAINGTD